MSVNKAILVGRLGQDPKLDGKRCTFGIATTETWKADDGSKQEATTWHNITVWGKLADLCAQYLSKGREVYVEGSIEKRQYKDKEGAEKWHYGVKAYKVVFLGSKADNTGADTEPAQGDDDDSDSLPF